MDGTLPPTRIGKAQPRRTRIVALDGIRGLLALHIVLGHFLRFADPSKVWMRFFAQVNVTVGAFFALSGYVTAYTCTRVGEHQTCARFPSSDRKQWWLSKAMTFYPVHWCVLLLFGPMFVYSDLASAPSLARGWTTATVNGLLSVTLTQAWLPASHAEIWNAPTWFLSSLSCCNAVLAMGLPGIAGMTKRRLRTALVWLYWMNLLPAVGYFWCVPASWRLVEGMTPPKAHPSLGLFNVVRFFPLFNAAETLMGAVACRLVMLDSRMSPQVHRSNPTLATAIPLGVTIGILIGRAVGWIPDCSDLLARKFVFVPIFLNFVMALHRNAVLSTTPSKPSDFVSDLLSTRLLVWLGTLSFPIYILHGPIGQLFYKRAIAGKLWGGVLRGKGYFLLYLTVLICSAMLVQKLFSNRNTKGVVNTATKKIGHWFGF